MQIIVLCSTSNFLMIIRPNFNQFSTFKFFYTNIIFKHLKNDQNAAKTKSYLFGIIAKITEQLGDEMNFFILCLKQTKKCVYTFIGQIFYMIEKNIFYRANILFTEQTLSSKYFLYRAFKFHRKYNAAMGCFALICYSSILDVNPVKPYFDFQAKNFVII